MRAPIVIARSKMELFMFLVIDKIISNGAIFCHVIRTRFMFHLSFEATSGNHQ
jgi:hypothetical protein